MSSLCGDFHVVTLIISSLGDDITPRISYHVICPSYVTSFCFGSPPTFCEDDRSSSFSRLVSDQALTHFLTQDSSSAKPFAVCMYVLWKIFHANVLVYLWSCMFSCFRGQKKHILSQATINRNRFLYSSCFLNLSVAPIIGLSAIIHYSVTRDPELKQEDLSKRSTDRQTFVWILAISSTQAVATAHLFHHFILNSAYILTV